MSTTETVASWVVELQLTDPASPGYGAVRVHHTPGLHLRGREYFRVLPYDASLGLLGLLGTRHPERLEVVERWIGWYLRHMAGEGPDRGVVLDHWYDADGAGETTCPARSPSAAANPPCDHVDAEDSAAATLLHLAWSYHLEGGRDEFLRRPEVRAGLATAAEVILRLQQDDGLTWAKRGYRVKYLMDNSEVFQGLRSMSLLQATVYRDPAASERYARAAGQVKAGILGSLYDGSSGLYRIALHEDGSVAAAEVDRWYPDAVAQVWPRLFGVLADPPGGPGREMRVLNDGWDGVRGADWRTGFVDPAKDAPWTSIGYAALLAGDGAAAAEHAEFVIRAQRLGRLEPGGFGWPFGVKDAGWLLMTLSALSSSPGRIPGGTP